MPTLTSLTIEELKAFAIHQAGLHPRRDRRPGWKSVFAFNRRARPLYLLVTSTRRRGCNSHERSRRDKPCRVALSNAGAVILGDSSHGQPTKMSRSYRNSSFTRQHRIRYPPPGLGIENTSRNGCEVLRRRIQIGGLGDPFRRRGAGRREGEISNVRACRWRGSRWTRFCWV